MKSNQFVNKKMHHIFWAITIPEHNKEDYLHFLEFLKYYNLDIFYYSMKHDQVLEK